ncbi:MAG TPA: GNAT family N-acetyltransferase [Elainellaceae cyanobacterium]
MAELLLPGYVWWRGSGLDRALLVKFMQRTYQELHPDFEFDHLAQTVDGYLSSETPIWWVACVEDASICSNASHGVGIPREKDPFSSPIACLWIGNAIDQSTGDRHAHIFLLYVIAHHRRRGIGSALMRHAEAWARQRGDRQIGLQVFQTNQPALDLYTSLGYQTQSIWMVKSIG